MMHVNQFQHVNNFLNLEVANDLRQFFGCVCGWMIGGNQRMETLNMRGTPIDCSFRFLFFFWWFCEWKICGRHAQCPEKSMQGIAPKMCDLTMDFSRMRSEGFPFIVGGLGVGPVFASRCSCRRDRRRDRRGNRRVNSVPMGKVAASLFLSCPFCSSAIAVTMVEAAKRIVFDRVKVYPVVSFLLL